MKIDRLNTLTMVKGDSESIVVIIGNYIFQEGDVVELTIRKTPTDDRLAHIIVEEFEMDRVIVNLKPEDTSKLRAGIYKYDIRLTTADGLIKTLVPCSDLILQPEVTYVP